MTLRKVSAMMDDLKTGSASGSLAFDRKPARKIVGTVTALFEAKGTDFVTSAVSEMELTFDGIPGDVHAGTTRRSGGREPWYPRGTEMRNERQVSIVSADELDATADAMGLREVKPEWIGANMVLDGITNLTWLPPRTLVFFENGVTLKIDGDNAPCRLAGRSIAKAVGRDDMELKFPLAARNRRGLVAWVEKPGRIERGERFRAQVPEQWIYEG